MTKETAAISGTGKRKYFYKPADVPADVKAKVTRWAGQAAAALELSKPQIVFVKEVQDESEATYKFDMLIVAHGTRSRAAYSTVDRNFTIYVNAACQVPEILAGIDSLVEQAHSEQRSNEPRTISGSQYKRR